MNIITKYSCLEYIYHIYCQLPNHNSVILPIFVMFYLEWICFRPVEYYVIFKTFHFFW